MEVLIFIAVVRLYWNNCKTAPLLNHFQILQRPFKVFLCYFDICTTLES